LFPWGVTTQDYALGVLQISVLWQSRSTQMILQFIYCPSHSYTNSKLSFFFPSLNAFESFCINKYTINTHEIALDNIYVWIFCHERCQYLIREIAQGVFKSLLGTSVSGRMYERRQSAINSELIAKRAPCVN
jgi:hypothetical protein